jgi:hypothetical protein
LIKTGKHEELGSVQAIEVDHVEELGQVLRDRRPRPLELMTTVELYGIEVGRDFRWLTSDLRAERFRQRVSSIR